MISVTVELRTVGLRRLSEALLSVILYFYAIQNSPDFFLRLNKRKLMNIALLIILIVEIVLVALLIFADRTKKGKLAEAASGGSIYALDPNGKPVDWWLIIKTPQNHKVSTAPCDCKTSCGKGDPSGKCYFYADSNNPTPKYMNECVSDPSSALMKTIKQAKSASGVGVWNDDGIDKNGKNIKGQSPEAHSKGMVAYNSGGGFVLNTTTPNFPVAGAFESGPGCGVQKNNTMYGQQFFCMSYDMDNLKKWGSGMYNADLSVTNPDLWTATDILSTHGVKGSNAVVDLTTSLNKVPIKLIVKGAGDRVNPWSLVSGSLGVPLQVQSWTGFNIPPYGPKGSGLPSGKWDWTSQNCDSQNKGLEQVCSINYGKGVQNAGNSQDHSKIGVSSSGDDWVIFGSMNEQTSQEKRGGEFYAMKNSQLHTFLKNGFSGRTRQVGADYCGAPGTQAGSCPGRSSPTPTPSPTPSPKPYPDGNCPCHDSEGNVCRTKSGNCYASERTCESAKSGGVSRGCSWEGR